MTSRPDPDNSCAHPLGQVERALVEAEIHTWEHHRLLRQWRRRDGIIGVAVT